MAAKIKTSISISEDALIKADQLVIAQRNATQANASVSSVVETLIQTAYANLKQITPRKDGKRTVGWDMQYGDFYVGYVDGVANKAQAETQLNNWVREELSR